MSFYDMQIGMSAEGLELGGARSGDFSSKFIRHGREVSSVDWGNLSDGGEETKFETNLAATRARHVSEHSQRFTFGSRGGLANGGGFQTR